MIRNVRAFSHFALGGDRGLTYRDKKPVAPPGLKPKDLVGIPWRVAFALQADGWYLRSFAADRTGHSTDTPVSESA